MTTLKSLVNRFGIKAETRLVDSNPNMTDMPSGSTHWKVTLRGFGRRMTVPFSMGPAHTSEPEAVGVLECLLSDSDVDNYDFEEWARNLGYDPDSRKAEKTYKACQKLTEKLHKFLGENFDDFLSADRD